MDFETFKAKVIDLFSQLLELRLIVSSPNEKVADVPAIYALGAVLIAPLTCVAAAVLGMIFKYSARVEHDEK